MTEPEAESASSPPSPTQLVEHFFRHETSRLYGAIVRLAGTANLQLAEDVTQEAMLKAMRVWSMGGVPPNPAAWITKVAMNLARDALRRQRMAASKEPAIATHREQLLPTPKAFACDEVQIQDDALRLMFVCCHPAIAPDAQVILALKALCGFATSEIARAFLSSPAAIEKQLTRTKSRIRDLNIAFDLPEGEDLEPRLRGVQGTLYLLFNEGYKANSGERLLRDELCQEAIRLASLLTQSKVGNHPRSHALLALMLLNAARFPTRVDTQGELMLLADQDRSLWDQALIERGLRHLAQGASGSEISVYHLQAAIAAAHCTASSFADTDWARIVGYYDALLALQPSPIVALNRSVAISQLHGPEAGLRSLETIDDLDRLEGSHLLHAVRGNLLSRLHRRREAAAAYRLALARANIGPEQEFLARKVEETTRSFIHPPAGFARAAEERKS